MKAKDIERILGDFCPECENMITIRLKDGSKVCGACGYQIEGKRQKLALELNRLLVNAITEYLDEHEHCPSCGNGISPTGIDIEEEVKDCDWKCSISCKGCKELLFTHLIKIGAE